MGLLVIACLGYSTWLLSWVTSLGGKRLLAWDARLGLQYSADARSNWAFLINRATWLGGGGLLDLAQGKHNVCLEMSENNRNL